MFLIDYFLFLKPGFSLYQLEMAYLAQESIRFQLETLKIALKTFNHF